MPNLHARLVPAALLATAAVALPAGVALAAQPKSAGAYYSPFTKQGANYFGVYMNKGRVAGGSGVITFKKAGKQCTPSGATHSQPFSVNFSLKKAVKANADGSFSFTAKNNDSTNRLTATITGRFTTSKKATLRFRSSYNGCKANFLTRNATWRLGG